MKRLQDALRPTGIPAYAAIWKPTAEYAQPPDQYLVYSTTMVESEHYDDRLVRYQTIVYLNLWSTIDPTSAILKVRAAMREAGYAMEEESDKGYNQPAYSTAANLYMMGWTWIGWEDAE